MQVFGTCDVQISNDSIPMKTLTSVYLKLDEALEKHPGELIYTFDVLQIGTNISYRKEEQRVSLG